MPRIGRLLSWCTRCASHDESGGRQPARQSGATPTGRTTTRRGRAIRWVSVWRGCPGKSNLDGSIGNRLFPVGNGESLAREIRGTRLLGSNAPRRPSPPSIGQVAAAMSSSSAVPQRDHQRTAASPHARGVSRRRAASGRAWARQRSRAAPRSPGSQSARRATRWRCCCSRGMRARAPGADGRRATPNRLPGP